MTLVVRFSNPVSFMLGDLLLTSEIGPEVGVQIPTVPWGDPKIRQAYVGKKGPSDIAQKVSLCGRNILLGWSGRFNVAREVVSGLYELNKDENIDLESLANYFEQLPKSADEVQILGLHDSSTKITEFDFGAEAIKLPTAKFGPISMIGTGLKLFTQHKDKLELPFSINPGASNAAGFLSQKIMAHVANLLALEMNTLDTIKSAFGAGYEIAYPHTDGGFRKMDGIAYLFWHADIDENNHLTIANWPTRGFQFNYKDELLALRTFEPVAELNAIAGAIFYVPPIYRFYTTSEITNPWTPELYSQYVVSFVSVHGPNAYNESYIAVFDRDYSKDLLQYVVKDKHVSFDKLDDFRDMVEELVRERRSGKK
jgi:hypothetical protein